MPLCCLASNHLNTCVEYLTHVPHILYLFLARLDQETSGIVIFSRTGDALTSLHKLFRLRKVEKMYTAIVWGHVAENKGQVNLPLSRKPNSPPLYCVNEALGKPSLTQWVVSSLVRLRRFIRLSNSTRVCG